MSRLIGAARALEPHDVYILFSHDAHFLNPLVGEEWRALSASAIVDDPMIERLVGEVLPQRLLTNEGVRERLPRGLYFPTPIARAIDALDYPEAVLGGDRAAELDRILDRFHYQMIQVDQDQEWTWGGRPVAGRTRRFFLENLGWQPAIGRFFFEYRVHANWWDKSYLDAEVTPLVAVQLSECQNLESEAASPGSTAEVVCGSGQRDRLRLDTFRLDERERLFCQTGSTGEVMFSDSLRFRLLSSATEDLQRLVVAGKEWPLHWPQEPQESQEPLSDAAG